MFWLPKPDPLCVLAGSPQLSSVYKYRSGSLPLHNQFLDHHHPHQLRGSEPSLMQCCLLWSGVLCSLQVFFFFFFPLVTRAIFCCDYVTRRLGGKGTVSDWQLELKLKQDTFRRLAHRLVWEMSISQLRAHRMGFSVENSSKQGTDWAVKCASC